VHAFDASPLTATAGAAPVPSLTGDAKVDGLLAKMTLDEKFGLIEGVADTSADPQIQAGYLPGVQRLGIPALKLADGPNGIVTKQDSTGLTGTMGLAATFSTRDAWANGAVVGRDARALGQDVALEPFVNMERDTSFTRAFNTLGEDPLLTSQIGAQTIRGIQSQGVMAQVKHYIAYDGANNVKVDAQTLHEIYLAPFDAAVKAGVASIMCSYNAINDAQACENKQLLTDVLRKELGFKGFVTSDWGANHSATSINAGLDMEMPGSGSGIPGYWSSGQLHAAVDAGQVSEARITEAAGRVLYEYDRFGLLDGRSKHTVTPIPVKADEQTVQRTAEDAATLLQNKRSLLPLPKTSLSSLAMIGPGAGQVIAAGTSGPAERPGGLVGQQTSALSALRQAAPYATVSYSVGDDITGTPVPAFALSHDGQGGLLRTTAGSGTSQVDPTLNFTHSNGASLAPGTAATWDGTLTVPEAGDYWLNLQSLGASGTLTIDGKLVTTSGSLDIPALNVNLVRYGVVHPTDGNAILQSTDNLANGRVQVALTAGSHAISVAATPDISGRPVEIRLNWVTPSQQAANTAGAVAAAKKAKIAVVFAWSDSSTDLSRPLPDGQDALISAVASVNPSTVVVLNTSSPIAMPWLSKVKSVLQMWYPGDRGGVATANVLLGKVNPGGKLPFTWPKSIEQELAHQTAHPERSSSGLGNNGPSCGALAPQVELTCAPTTYSEGINIGYRFYDATGETPLYPFGYGLSYSSFAYHDLAVRQHAGKLQVTVIVANTSDTAGDEVPQVYLGVPTNKPAGVQFAVKALAAFARIHLAAGQSKRVTLDVEKRQLSYWSTSANDWEVATGKRIIYVGSSSQGLPVHTTATIS
jgi:beta-glucosidase